MASKNIILTPTADLTEFEWQDLRRSFSEQGLVGGSDAGALLGLDKYRSPVIVFYDALGLGKQRSMNQIMLHGKLLESYIADMWEFFDGTDAGLIDNYYANNRIKRAEEYKYIVQNKRYPALFANVDKRITSYPGKTEDGILEIKIIGSSQSDMYEMGFPPKYIVQVQTYLLINELSYGEICLLKDGRELMTQYFDADPITQDLIVAAANDHQQRVSKAIKAIAEFLEYKPDATTEELRDVACEFEPEADSSDSLADFLSERHKARSKENQVMGDNSLLEACREYKRVASQLKQLEEEKQLFGNRIRQYMTKHAANSLVFQDNASKVTWRKQFAVTVK